MRPLTRRLTTTTTDDATTTTDGRRSVDSSTRRDYDSKKPTSAATMPTQRKTRKKFFFSFYVVPSNLPQTSLFSAAGGQAGGRAAAAERQRASGGNGRRRRGVEDANKQKPCGDARACEHSSSLRTPSIVTLTTARPAPIGGDVTRNCSARFLTRLDWADGRGMFRELGRLFKSRTRISSSPQTRSRLETRQAACSTLA